MAKLIRLRDDLDDYHERRRVAHGHLFVAKRRYKGLVEAVSVATGMLCTLDALYTEEAPDAVQEP